jgi:hypothetical protein
MGGALPPRPIGSALVWKRRPFNGLLAGLDISMDETHVCVVDRQGSVIH